jgi:hypothetical protein
VSRFRRRSDGPGDDYLRTVTGPAAVPAAEPDEFGVPVDIVIAPAASTVDELLSRLDRLRQGGRLVGPHRIVVTTITTPDPVPVSEPARPDPADRVGSGPDRISDPADRPPDPQPLALTPSPGGSDPAPPTEEAVALLIGRLNGRPVTADQLRLGLRIGSEKARELREQVNAELYPQAGDSR